MVLVHILSTSKQVDLTINALTLWVLFIPVVLVYEHVSTSWGERTQKFVMNK